MIGRTSKDFITVKDVPANEFIKAYAEHLKKTQKVIPMKNYFILKTGHSREISPVDQDWFYVRTAALARKLFLRPGLGVGTLQHIYGKKGNNGHRRKHHTKGSGKIIRYALQQLSEANILMKKNDKRNKSILPHLHEEDSACLPRIVTPEGQKELNEIAK